VAIIGHYVQVLGSVPVPVHFYKAGLCFLFVRSLNLNLSVLEGKYRTHDTSHYSLASLMLYYASSCFVTFRSRSWPGPRDPLVVSPARGVIHDVTFLSRDQLRLLLFRDV
jgi:hypothetical protein